MIDIAFNVAGRLQHDALATQRAHHVATHDHLLGDDGTRDTGFFADDDICAVDIPLHIAVDLNLAYRDQIAMNC